MEKQEIEMEMKMEWKNFNGKWGNGKWKMEIEIIAQ